MTRTDLTQEQWELRAAQARYNPTKLARVCGISPRQLQRVFLTQFCQSPKEWLDEQRIKVAQQMLLRGESINTVAHELGYKQTSHFCRQFRQFKKIKPSQFVALSVAYDGCRVQITNVVRR